MDPRIPYSRQSIDEEDVAAVADALRSDFLTTGERVNEFERDLSQATGAPFVTVLSSGTAALHAAYSAIGLKQGDEVLIPPLTFVATANAALYRGARPVFVDVEPGTGLINPDAIADGLSDRTRAVVGVDYSGLPADYSQLRERVRDLDIPVFADAAHSLGAQDRGASVGCLADLTTFSFHPVKHITTGEGGAVATGNELWHDRVVTFRSHGIVRDRRRLSHDEGPWYHEMQEIGYNYRLTDIQCALGASQLRKLERFVSRRRAIAMRYDAAFSALDALLLPGRRAGAESSWHLYVVRVAKDSRSRRKFFERLSADGLGVQVHYIPVYLQPYYSSLGYRPGQCPIAEDFYRRAVSIPIFPAMSDADVDRVIEAVTNAAHDILD